MSYVCVELHLDGEGKHTHVDTHTPTSHVQTQLVHNSSPPGEGMEVELVLENQSQDLLQWSAPPVGKERQEECNIKIPCKNDIIYKPLAYDA